MSRYRSIASVGCLAAFLVAALAPREDRAYAVVSGCLLPVLALTILAAGTAFASVRSAAS